MPFLIGEEMAVEKTLKHDLIIRTDSSSKIGVGHVMRCIALSQAWQDLGGSVTMMTCCENQSILKRLKEEEIEVVQLRDSSSFQMKIEAMAPAIVVLDGYHFSIEDQRAIRASGHKLLVIDDINHLPEYECDFLLNQNINAAEFVYNINADCEMFLGTKYVLLRREFRSAKLARCKSKTILVTMGGADPDNVTLKVIRALKNINLEDLNVRVIVGSANVHKESLVEEIENVSNIELVFNADMVNEMLSSNFVISAAGSTCWELLALDVDFATVILADNQEKVAKYLEGNVDIKSLGWADESFESRLVEFLNKKIKESMNSIQRKSIVDGQGAIRVAEGLKRGLRV